MMGTIPDIPLRRKSFNSNVAFQHGIADGALAENKLASNGSDLEWEYEYSTTETETFYVTLDLPVAKSKSNAETKDPSGGRITKRKDKWLNSTHAPFIDERRNNQKDDAEMIGSEPIKDAIQHNNTPQGRNATQEVKSKNATSVQRKDTTVSSDDDADADDEFEDELPVSKEDGTSASENGTQKSQRGRETVFETDGPKATHSPSTTTRGIPHDIQILDLHSNNPIVVYQNQQFQCNWAENIGTELLFIKRSNMCGERERNLPIVRELPGEVDLLAISGVRVVGRPVNIRPKEKASNNASKEKAEIPPKQTRAKKTKTPLPDGVNRIPVGNGAKEDRKAQARFLERLTAIKLKKGEQDEVTVNAIPRQEGRARKKREAKRKREQGILRTNRESEQRKALARIRIAEFDALDAAQGPSQGSRMRRGDEDSDSDDEEDEDEDESLTDDAATAPDNEQSAFGDDGDGVYELGSELRMGMGEEENDIYMFGDENYELDDDEEDDPDSHIHTRPFNVEDMDVDMGVGA